MANSLLKKALNAVVGIIQSVRPNGSKAHNEYFVASDECICCGNCKWRSPQTFAMKIVKGKSLPVAYVLRQPKTPQEVEFFKDGMASCPAHAIYGPWGNSKRRRPRNEEAKLVQSNIYEI